MDGFCDINGVEAKGWAMASKPAVVSSKNVQQEANINRLASDCWEVDIIGSPEAHDEKDFMHQMNSGIDLVIARACAEKGIAIEFCFANVLNSFGRRRAQIMARMMQNVKLCRLAGCSMVISSGARDKWAARAPRDLMAFGVLIGMTLTEAREAISGNPSRILERSRARNDPNVILKGLEVKKWGSEKKEKKKYGWY